MDSNKSNKASAEQRAAFQYAAMREGAVNNLEKRDAGLENDKNKIEARQHQFLVRTYSKVFEESMPVDQ